MSCSLSKKTASVHVAHICRSALRCAQPHMLRSRWRAFGRAAHHGLTTALRDRNNSPAQPGSRGRQRQVDELWILDVEGSIVILDATYGPRRAGRPRRRAACPCRVGDLRGALQTANSDQCAAGRPNGPPCVLPARMVDDHSGAVAPLDAAGRLGMIGDSGEVANRPRRPRRPR